jgi:heat shock protein HtpX
MLFGLMALAAGVGFVLNGIEGIILGALLARATLAVGSASGGALFRQAFGAITLNQRNAPDLVRLVAELARRADLPRAPTIHLLPSPVLQAMSAGDRRDPAIAVTSGLLRALPPREIAAVLAHEIAHIRHGDVFIMRLGAAAGAMTQVTSTVGLVLLVAFVPVLWATDEILVSPIAIALLIFSPVISDLLQLSLARRREFLADAGAVELTGDPGALASALQRLERLRGDNWERFAARGGRWLHWFRTHPSTWERVQRLSELIIPDRPDLPLATRLGDPEPLHARQHHSWRRRLGGLS